MATYGPTGIAAGGDDYLHRPGTWESTGTIIVCGQNSDGVFHSSVRFLGVDIPTGATVSSSTIALKTASGQSTLGTLYTKICAVDEDNPAAATSDATCTTDDGIRTTTKVDWDQTISDQNNVSHTTSNFASVVQE